MSTRQNLLFAIFGITGLAATLAASHRLGVRADDYRFFDELVEVKHLISTRYIEQPDAGKLREGAIKGMVEALADPYTVYVPASERGEFNKSLTGEYVGIGAQVNMQQGWLTIVSPLEDSPAFRVGLMPDDRVVEIEGQSTQNKSVEACVGMLMGEPGTPVKIVVERKGARLEFEIIRERIKTRAVKSFHRRDDDPNNWEFLIDRDRRIAYVRLTNFTPRCSQEVLEALRSVGAHEGRLGGLVLDLRGNPGGLLSEAEAIADFFLKEGVIVSTRGRAHPEKVTRAVSAGTLPDFPLAVLINGASASASEVLAGALVENNRAVAVGARSFGKGSVQSVIELPSGNGAEIKLTEQGYFLPSGRSITRKDDSAQWGVDPSDGFYVPMSDAQIIAMMEVRRRQEVLRADQPGQTDATDWTKTDSILETMLDPQLTAAVRAVQARIDSGAWSPTGETGSPAGRIAAEELRRLEQFQQRLMRELERAERRMAALEEAADSQTTTLADLWPDDLDLTGGTLEVRDRDGNVVTLLDITGNNLERWLLDADVQPRHREEPPAKPESPGK
ncbi:MAG: S41 family peptidase [Phycisphaeraceae bacterium]|nr:S41 family peptidase [Phycisphaeraceae bacterium]